MCPARTHSPFMMGQKVIDYQYHPAANEWGQYPKFRVDGLRPMGKTTRCLGFGSRRIVTCNRSIMSSSGT